MTRWLVVVLLAANLGFMAWMYQRLARDPGGQAAPSAPATEGAEIRLLSEVDPGQQQAEASNVAPVREDPIDAPAQEAPVPDADFVAIVPGPWTGRATPAGADEPPPGWMTLEQRAAVAAVDVAPSLSRGEAGGPAAAPGLHPGGQASTSGAPPAAAAADTCLTLGPLTAEVPAQKLSDWLVAKGGTAAMRPEVTGRPDAHWVYVGPFPDLTAARLESDRLRDLGVSDHLAVRHQQLGPVVSLGLYSTKEGRERRIATLRAAGVEPVVVPRGPRELRWWVDARLPPESGLTAESIAAAAPGSEGVTASPCETGTAASGGQAPLTTGTPPANRAE